MGPRAPVLVDRSTRIGTPQAAATLSMTQVLVSSVSTGGSGGEDRLTENISLNFAKVKVEYTPQKQHGTADKTMTMGWDIPANVKA